jgi:hypothetical protein
VGGFWSTRGTVSCIRVGRRVELTSSSGVWQRACSLPQCTRVLLQGLWSLRLGVQRGGQLRRPIHSAALLELAARLAFCRLEGRAQEEDGTRRGMVHLKEQGHLILLQAWQPVRVRGRAKQQEALRSDSCDPVDPFPSYGLLIWRAPKHERYPAPSGPGHASQASWLYFPSVPAKRMERLHARHHDTRRPGLPLSLSGGPAPIPG